MKKIVGIIKPFVHNNQFTVFEDGELIDIQLYNMQNINESLFALIDKHEIEQVDLAGPKAYVNGIVDQFKTAEMTKYNMNKIEFNII